MATSGGMGPKSVKLDEAQASAKSCAGRPDFLPCDGGQSACATHSHGKCFKLHWCCHLGWCHCKYVYQPMTNVCQLPSTPVPFDAPEHHCTSSSSLSVSLAERFLRSAPALVAPPPASQTRFCVIAELFVDDYVVKRINGKMCYVQRLPLTPPPKAAAQQAPAATSRDSSPSPGFPPASTPKRRQSQQPRRPQPRSSDRSPLEDYDEMAKAVSESHPTGQKSQPCSSPSSSEDSGINAAGGTYTESYDEDEDDEDGEEEDEEGDEEEETNSDVESSRGSLWGNEEFSLLAPSRSLVEIIEKIETTV